MICTPFMGSFDGKVTQRDIIILSLSNQVHDYLLLLYLFKPPPPEPFSFKPPFLPFCSSLSIPLPTNERVYIPGIEIDLSIYLQYTCHNSHFLHPYTLMTSPIKRHGSHNRATPTEPSKPQSYPVQSAAVRCTFEEGANI